jgi:multiple sugar transport system ATP-binding protein
LTCSSRRVRVTYATFQLAGAPVVAELHAYDVSQPGETVPIYINMSRASIFEAETQRAL